ncbi:MAG TPA: response regulator [bacterium (Candidatus Stahlbacteria)]|nr:response regulator [Candidatus Stahlbacteria bacterium]
MSKKISVLIADDDIGMTETLSDILSLKGYDVVVANSGFEAIEKARSKTFDVILLDVKMPDINGVDVFRQIKTITPKSSVILMTAYALHDLIEQAKKEGVLAVLSKPIDVEKLVLFLEEFKDESAVLIVDDDRNFCETLKDSLIERGYRVDFAIDAPRAIDMVSQAKYDYVLLDMKLDGANGLDVLVTIKRITSGIVVILMTGYQQEMKDLIEEGLRRTAYSCLYKPFEIDEVLRIFNRIKYEKVTGGSFKWKMEFK